MNALSIGPLAIGFICLYLGLYHLWFYRKVPALKETLYFGLSALCVGLYGFCCSMLYQTRDPILAVIFNRLQISSMILFCPIIVYFVSTFVGQRIGWGHRVCFWSALICTPLVLFTSWVFAWETHTVQVPI